jgi:hypothetical protein
MPDNRQAGMLEDLCLIAASSADPAFPCIEAFFSCVHAAVTRRPSIMSKARVHAWLATQERAGLSLGVAAQSSFLPFSDPAFQPLFDFVRSL